MRIHRAHSRKHRRGVATVEFAIILPLLMFLFGIGVDWARAFYYHLTITNASRNAAIWGCDSPGRAADTAGIEAVARKDTTSLGAGVTVESSVVNVGGTDYVRESVLRLSTSDRASRYPVDADHPSDGRNARDAHRAAPRNVLKQLTTQSNKLPTCSSLSEQVGNLFYR